jgi:hypothetical protein
MDSTEFRRARGTADSRRYRTVAVIGTIARLQTCTSRADWTVVSNVRHSAFAPTGFRTGDDVLPRSGDVIHVTKAASVQFAAPMLFRVIRVHDWPTYEGWIWLDGYELNASGDAVERRSIFVQVGGLRQVGKAPDPRTRNGRQPGLTSGVIPTRSLRANR